MCPCHYFRPIFADFRRFSPIFADFRRFSPIFADFRRLSVEKNGVYNFLLLPNIAMPFFVS
jgi:hypothetical protein